MKANDLTRDVIAQEAPGSVANLSLVPSPTTTMTSPVKMEFPAPTPPPGQYTILRIKRKRNEEPLDALGEAYFTTPQNQP